MFSSVANKSTAGGSLLRRLASTSATSTTAGRILPVPKSNNVLFVKNVDYKATTKNIRRALRPLQGTITDVHIATRPQGRPVGHAHVVYENDAQLEKALAHSKKQHLGCHGRHLSVYRYRPAEPTPRLRVVDAPAGMSPQHVADSFNVPVEQVEVLSVRKDGSVATFSVDVKDTGAAIELLEKHTATPFKHDNQPLRLGYDQVSGPPNPTLLYKHWRKSVEALREQLAPYADSIKNIQTGKKGWGYITFSSTEAAADALKKLRLTPGDQQDVPNVKFAIPGAGLLH